MVVTAMHNAEGFGLEWCQSAGPAAQKICAEKWLAPKGGCTSNWVNSKIFNVKVHRDTAGTSIFFDTAFASVNIHLLRTKSLRFWSTVKMLKTFKNRITKDCHYFRSQCKLLRWVSQKIMREMAQTLFAHLCPWQPKNQSAEACIKTGKGCWKVVSQISRIVIW